MGGMIIKAGVKRKLGHLFTVWLQAVISFSVPHLSQVDNGEKEKKKKQYVPT